VATRTPNSNSITGFVIDYFYVEDSRSKQNVYDSMSTMEHFEAGVVMLQA
jgi:hypothetical protein